MEHSEDVSRVHAIAEELDSEAWIRLLNPRHRLGRITDAHEAMLDTSEHAGVGLVRVRDDLDLGHGADRVSLLQPIDWHVIGDDIVGQVHVLGKERLELKTSIEALATSVLKHQFPDQLFFADSAESLVLWGIEVRSVLRVDAMSVRIFAAKLVRGIITPVMKLAVSAVRDNLRLSLDALLMQSGGITAASLLNFTSFVLIAYDFIFLSRLLFLNFWLTALWNSFIDRLGELTVLGNHSIVLTQEFRL